MVFSLYKEETKAKRSFWIIVIVDYIWSRFIRTDLENYFRSSLAILGSSESQLNRKFAISSYIVDRR